jgi:hypothetical protein
LDESKPKKCPLIIKGQFSIYYISKKKIGPVFQAARFGRPRGYLPRAGTLGVP